MTITLVAAMDLGGVIGLRGGMPWRLPADLRRFKRLTMGKPVVMGRKTHESIGRPLPGRLNIVLTRDAGFRADGCTVVRSPDEALAAADDAPEVMVVGGAAVYELFLARADRFHLTLVRGTFDGDTFFPDWDPREWEETGRDDRPADGRHAVPYSFITLERRPGASGPS